MVQHVNVDILQNVMLPYAEDEMPFIWDSRTMTASTRAKKAKKWFADYIIDIMEWPSVSGSQSNQEFED